MTEWSLLPPDWEIDLDDGDDAESIDLDSFDD